MSKDTNEFVCGTSSMQVISTGDISDYIFETSPIDPSLLYENTIERATKKYGQKEKDWIILRSAQSSGSDTIEIQSIKKDCSFGMKRIVCGSSPEREKFWDLKRKKDKTWK